MPLLVPDLQLRVGTAEISQLVMDGCCDGNGPSITYHKARRSPRQHDTDHYPDTPAEDNRDEYAFIKQQD